MATCYIVKPKPVRTSQKGCTWCMDNNQASQQRGRRQEPRPSLIFPGPGKQDSHMSQSNAERDTITAVTDCPTSQIGGGSEPILFWKNTEMQHFPSPGVLVTVPLLYNGLSPLFLRLSQWPILHPLSAPAPFQIPDLIIPQDNTGKKRGILLIFLIPKDFKYPQNKIF